MATVVGGVGYGLYSLGKRYVYPLVAPPTPEKLEQDKKSIEEQFDKAFALVEQLAQDTEALKNAEQERTEKLDNAISELESVMSDLKAANRRREDDAQRIRDEVQGLKDAIPKAMDNQKQLTDNRLREINTELSSLKTLVSQRMTPTASTSGPGHYVRQSSGNVTPAANRPTSAKVEDAEESSSTKGTETPKSLGTSSFSRASNLPSGGAKASIPAWQMAMANKNTGASATTNGEESKEAGNSSS